MHTSSGEPCDLKHAFPTSLVAAISACTDTDADDPATVLTLRAA